MTADLQFSGLTLDYEREDVQNFHAHEYDLSDPLHHDGGRVLLAGIPAKIF
ncbi:hypothetical protein NSP_24570 [Nodularia spumigena CCY9414]|nr:hypothetical protein NSP_24570 [Nodularia spumigena CCY9414]